jgi:hypothetical protein
MRLGFIYAAHGVIHSEWKPRQTGRKYELSPNLQPLEGVRDHFNVFTNLSHREAASKGDGSGDHNRASAAWLTGVHAYDRTRPGAEIRLAASADQIAARHLGRDSAVPSIEMTLDPATQGACDAGDCFYVNTVSWRSETSPNMPELHPRVIFERLFGDGGSPEQQRARIRKEGSLLDSVLEETSSLTARSAARTRPSCTSTWIRCARSSSAFSTRNRASRNRWSCPTARSAFPPASRSTRS